MRTIDKELGGLVESAELDEKSNVFELSDDGFDGDNLEQREAERTIHRLEFPQGRKKEFAELLGALPKGVAIVGGAARSIARSAIMGDSEPVRDIDLVEIVMPDGEASIDEDTRWALSHRFMPDDTEYGHPMGLRTLEQCFLECDMTINQCAVIDGELYVSDAALSDFKNAIIRPSTAEKYYDDTPVSSRVALRMLMQKVVSEQVSGGEYELVDAEPQGDYNFQMAIALNKMMGRGRRAAEEFVAQLAEYGYIDEDFETNPNPIELAKTMFRNQDVVNFEYRNTASSERPLSTLGRAKRAMVAFHATSPVLRRVMDEYDYDYDYEDTDYYTDEDFADLNQYCVWIDPSYDEYYDEEDDNWGEEEPDGDDEESGAEW